MGSNERRTREKNELRTRILDTARDLFAREGYEAVSMRRIADAIEYSPTAIYSHFKDKSELIRELCREDFGRLTEGSVSLQSISDPVERLYELGVTYVRFAVQHPNHYRLMFMTPLPADGPTELDDDDRQRKGDPDVDGYAFLQMTIKQIFEQRRFSPRLTNPELITQVMWAGVHGVASLQIAKGKDPWIMLEPLEERTKLMLDALLAGMGVQRSPRPEQDRPRMDTNEHE